MKRSTLLISCFLMLCAFAGKSQNLLSGKFSKGELAKVLIAQEKWVLFPKIGDQFS